MLDPALLDILVCPESQQPVALADAEVLEGLNRRIREGGVRTRSGTPVSAELESALIRQDRTIAYPVRDSIPIMLIDEAILLGLGVVPAGTTPKQ